MEIGGSSTIVERKVIEKNRRNLMKALCFKLNSLLPNHQAIKEAPALPDQLDEAVIYIEGLKEKLKETKEKKERLTRSRKRSYRCTDLVGESTTSSSYFWPRLVIREVMGGSMLEVVLITGLDYQFLFYDAIRILHEDSSIEVVSANFSVVGNLAFHSLHAEVQDHTFGASRTTERLNRLINGSTSELELDSQLWEFEMNSEVFDF